MSPNGAQVAVFNLQMVPTCRHYSKQEEKFGRQMEILVPKISKKLGTEVSKVTSLKFQKR
jgi:hypothetical protein